MGQVSNITNINDLGGLLAIANNNTGGWAWTGMLWLVFFVMLISMAGFGWETALLVSSFISLMIGTLMAYMGLISFTMALVFLGITLLMIIVIIYTNRQDNQ